MLKQGFLLWGLVCVFLVHFEKARGYNILKPPQAHLQRQNTARISCHRSFKGWGAKRRWAWPRLGEQLPSPPIVLPCPEALRFGVGVAGVVRGHSPTGCGRRVWGLWARWRSAATLDVRRALLTDLLSYGDCSGSTRVAAVRLGWHLAADFELVRTRGIRLTSARAIQLLKDNRPPGGRRVKTFDTGLGCGQMMVAPLHDHTACL